MKLSPNIKDLLAKHCNHNIAKAGDCAILALDIESKTGQHMGVNTLKRLLGFINDEREPRTTTLNIIAQYLGYDNWESLELLDNEAGNSNFNETLTEIHTTQLKHGARIKITYLPNRKLVIKHLGDNSFVVLESENSKLHVGDMLRIDHIVRGFPLLVSKVVRNNTSMGTFTAGKQQGINFEMI